MADVDSLSSRRHRHDVAGGSSATTACLQQTKQDREIECLPKSLPKSPRAHETQSNKSGDHSSFIVNHAWQQHFVGCNGWFSTQQVLLLCCVVGFRHAWGRSLAQSRAWQRRSRKINYIVLELEPQPLFLFVISSAGEDSEEERRGGRVAVAVPRRGKGLIEVVVYVNGQA